MTLWNERILNKFVYIRSKKNEIQSFNDSTLFQPNIGTKEENKSFGQPQNKNENIK